MRNISLSKLQNLLFVLFLFALTGCGGSSSNIASSDSAANAKITAKFDWSAAKSTAKTVGMVPADVYSVRLKITGPTVNAVRYTRVKASFPAADGGGTVAVAPGKDLIVVAEALSSSDVLLYEAIVSGVEVKDGETTDLGTILMAAPNYKAADEPCLGCHENSRAASGNSLVAEYKQSRHYSVTVSPAPKNGVNSTGCAGCHGPTHNDLNPAAGFDNSRCYECHNAAGNFPDHKAEYYLNKTDCTACHQAHRLEFQQVPDLAASGHGTLTQLAWSDRDFSASLDCNACHTPSGFVQAVDSNWTVTTATNTGMSALTCATCHSGNSYHNSVRTITGNSYTAGMGGFGAAAKATVTYENMGESNVCIPCHASRENGQSIIKGVTNYANQSFKNPHYLGAAAVFYGKGGFQFYSSASQTQYAPQAYTSKYGVVVDGVVIPAAAASTSNSTPAIAIGDALVGDKAAWSHGKLGMNNFATTLVTARPTIVAAKGNLVNTGTVGQCVACHLGPEKAHSFDAFEGAEGTWVKTTPTDPPDTRAMADGTYAGCYGCHTNEDMKEVAELDEYPKYKASMDFFKWQLAQNGAVYADAYPYFYKADGVTALKNWIATATADGMVVTGANVTGAANMGAAMNYKLLNAEKGAHVHNRTFMKQLIFDSIQYLQKGEVKFSNRRVADNATADPNGLINFSNYSTSLGANNAGATVATVRGYIVRKNTSAPVAGMYTRP
ncbi:MAG: hypothetical protein PHN84_06390 [Desulfuromonadaceae bacterium]|nr:hypothetical protein [Desulfuromonadaceae bacterium]MDD2855391.1 hypothetical protein [Desulfuromonadaceae bacterium]